MLADTPTDNIATRALQGFWDLALWLKANLSRLCPLCAVPAGFDPTTYTSLMKVAQNLVNVAILPFTVANLLAQGQWGNIQTNHQHRHHHPLHLADVRLATSITQTLNWILTGDTPSTMMAAPLMVDLLQANEVSLLADTPTNNVLSAGAAGCVELHELDGRAAASKPGLPTGFDPNDVHLAGYRRSPTPGECRRPPFAVANLALQGQWDMISPTTTDFFTSLHACPPRSPDPQLGLHGRHAHPHGGHRSDGGFAASQCRCPCSRTRRRTMC